jgi:hypothetical protein
MAAMLTGKRLQCKPHRRTVEGMTTARAAVTRLPGAGTCDACHHHATIVFRVDFDDASHSVRCARHVAAMYDHAAHRQSNPDSTGLLPAMPAMA